MDQRHEDVCVPVTGKLIEQRLDDGGMASWLDGELRHGRGLHERQVIEWSDPRLPPVKLTVFNFAQYPHPSHVTAVFVGAHLLSDDHGSWVGTSTGVTYPDGSIEGQDVLIGHGAYEGLHAVLHASAETTPADGGVTTWRGMIFAGSPPPVPEPL